jgi:hypothetical protein
MLLKDYNPKNGDVFINERGQVATVKFGIASIDGELTKRLDHCEGDYRKVSYEALEPIVGEEVTPHYVSAAPQGTPFWAEMHGGSVQLVFRTDSGVRTPGYSCGVSVPRRFFEARIPTPELTSLEAPAARLLRRLSGSYVMAELREQFAREVMAIVDKNYYPRRDARPVTNQEGSVK